MTQIDLEHSQDFTRTLDQYCDLTDGEVQLLKHAYNKDRVGGYHARNFMFSAIN